MQQYMTKALSEAKVNLSWTNPNPAYVDAVHGFLRAILMPDARGREPRFVETMAEILPALRDVWRGELAGAGGAEDGLAGGAGFLSGNGDVGSEPGGSGQPASGGLRKAAAGAGMAEGTGDESGRAGGVPRGAGPAGGWAGEAVDDPSGAAAAESDGGYVPARRICAGDGYKWIWGARGGVHARRTGAGGGSAVCLHADGWEGAASAERRMGARGTAGAGDGRRSPGECVYRRSGAC